MAAAPGNEVSLVLIELGVAVVGLAILARLANRLGFSAIPFYLLAGLAFGNGGLLPLQFGKDFVHVGSEVGVVLLLFMLGLEYTGEKLVNTLRTGYAAGLIDFVLNFTPGLLAGLILGISPLISVLLGGVTYISSSGVIAKVLQELGRMANPETAIVVSVLVLEDLAMAVYLPIVGVLLAGTDAQTAAVSVSIALITVFAVLYFAIKMGKRVSRFVAHQADEVVLLSSLGLVLLVAGLAQSVQVSAAIGAFLVGVAISGPIALRAKKLLSPLRDLFAATFFLFFGLQVDPRSLPPVLLIAGILALVSAASKLLTGVWIARRDGLTKEQGIAAGATLVARGEFSIVIAGLGAEAEPRLGALSAAYVLILAIIGPIAARLLGTKPTPAAA